MFASKFKKIMADPMEAAVEKLAAVLKEQDLNGTLDQSADTQELISKISAVSASASQRVGLGQLQPFQRWSEEALRQH